MNKPEHSERRCGARSDGTIGLHVIVPDIKAGSLFYQKALHAKLKRSIPEETELTLDGRVSILLVLKTEDCRWNCFNRKNYDHGKTPRLELVFPIGEIDSNVKRFLRVGSCETLTLLGDNPHRLRYAIVKDPFGTCWAFATPVEKSEGQLQLVPINSGC